jgi:uncharacterized RDD family membrane protein YckC
MRLPWRRIAAWAIDWLCIIGWVAVTAAVGVPLYLAGVIAPVGQLTLNVVGALVVVVPVVVGAALFERTRGGTPGKRVLRLRVESGGAQPSFVQALGRNALKIGVPWLIGHAAVFALVSTAAEATVPVPVWILTVLAYVIPLVYLVTLFLPPGRTPYDSAVRTIVVRADEVRVDSRP